MRIHAFASLFVSCIGPFGGTGESALAAARTEQNIAVRKNPARADCDVLFTMPVGDLLHYASAGVSEALPSGPEALLAFRDGTFWIADTVTSRLIHLDRAGLLIDLIDLSGRVTGIEDMKMIGDDLVLLDIAAVDPKVLRVSQDGSTRAVYTIPPQRVEGLSGIAVGDLGEIWLEQERGSRVSLVATPDGEPASEPVAGYTFGSTQYVIGPEESLGSMRRRIFANDRPVEIAVDHVLGGVRIVGPHPESGILVAVEEVNVADSLQVDQTVRRYDAEGRELAIARVPVAQSYTYVHSRLSVGADGNVYALITRPRRVAVCRLKFQTALAPVLSSAQDNGEGPENGDSYGIGSGCRSRLDMWYNAFSYYANTVYLSSTNTDGACSGRGKPRYILGTGTYPSVPYSWGDWETPSGFNALMYPGTYKAGDINTAYNESCSKGVDCSGLVSRAWCLSTKYSTSMLPNVSRLLSSTSALVYGDILNRSGVHVVLFDYANNGVYAFESTTSLNYDRVVYTFFDWSRYIGYQPRRYNNVCQ